MPSYAERPGLLERDLAARGRQRRRPLLRADRQRAISAAIERLLQDSALRDRLRAAGPEQAKRFTWQRTAEGTLASYERALATA
jgi:glycosyltransferase involved in cell wall biosynthesis